LIAALCICLWESVTLVGTTNSDYEQAAPDDEPVKLPEEVAYLMDLDTPKAIRAG
jgi:hypothetical protein